MTKYSLDMAIGELIQNNDVVQLVKEFFPQIIGSSILEFAVNIRLSDAIPMLGNLVQQDRLKEFIGRLLTL